MQCSLVVYFELLRISDTRSAVKLGLSRVTGRISRRCTSIRAPFGPKAEQILPRLLCLRPIQHFLCFLPGCGFRETRAEHQPFARVSAKRKAHHGLNAGSEMATGALHEGREGARAHALIFDRIETMCHGRED